MKFAPEKKILLYARFLPNKQYLICLIVAFDEFETHTGVVIRTFPETRLIILLVHRTIFEDSPVPLTVLADPADAWLHSSSNEMATQKILFGTEILIEVDMTDDILALYPPLALEIKPITILPMLIYHASIRA